MRYPPMPPIPSRVVRLRIPAVTPLQYEIECGRSLPSCQQRFHLSGRATGVLELWVENNILGKGWSFSALASLVTTGWQASDPMYSHFPIAAFKEIKSGLSDKGRLSDTRFTTRAVNQIAICACKSSSMSLSATMASGSSKYVSGGKIVLVVAQKAAQMSS